MVTDTKAPAEYDKAVKTICKMCWLQCGINAYVKDGKIIKVTGMKEHPLNEGEICVKAEHCIDYVYNKERLRYPMLKVGGEFQRITWEQALDTLTRKIKEAKAQYGDNSLMFFYGDPTGMVGPCGAMLGQRFCDIFGTTYRSGPDSY
jgi:anaerobic selenocysteine-containing dehydrogenase